MSDQNQTVQFQQSSIKSPPKIGMKKIVLVLMIIISLGLLAAIVVGVLKLRELSSVSTNSNSALPSINNPFNGEEKDSQDKITSNLTVSSDIVQRYRYVITNSAVTSATTHVIYEGKLMGVDNQGGFEKRIGLQYVLELKIKGIGAVTSQIYFAKADMSKLKFVQKVDEKENTISLADFKIGDSVKLDLTLDEMKPIYNNVIDGRLIKL